jgi:competence/damage-inducible protein CinA-like protein
VRENPSYDIIKHRPKVKMVKGAMLTVEVLTIGDELNRGEIIDTNSSWLAERLTALGAHVRWRSSVTDDASDMTAALKTASARADVVVTSGGLGPTDDDRTVDVVCALAGVAPLQEPSHFEKMRVRFAERGFAMTPNNLRQVRVPTGAEVLENRKGLAPGFGVRIGRAQLYVMPGVPREMKSIFDDHVAPRVAAAVGGASLHKRTWRVAGKGESHVDHALAGLLDGVADATLHFRIAYPENLVTVVVRRADAAEATRVLDALDAEVRARLGDHVYATGDTTLAEAVGARLMAAKATLAVAESCTGGLVGQLITAVPGSSRWFRGGVIAYANELKRDLLGVAPATLEAHGAVSEPTVIEMADGARRGCGATWAIAITGVAGPDGGTPDKPVGTVFVAVTRDGKREVRKLFWPPTAGGKDGREQVRQLAAHAALHLLYKSL